MPNTCTIEDCEKPARAHGWCYAHAWRWRTYGDPLHPGKRKPGTDYRSAHKRVARRRGKASEHACASCSEPAFHWSYDHRDPDEFINPATGCPYSLDPDHYQPKCVPCHLNGDLARRAAERAQEAADREAMERARDVQLLTFPVSKNARAALRIPSMRSALLA